MSKTKREREREIWEAVQPLLDLPDPNTQEGHAVYMRVRRRTEKLARNPLTFKEFFLHYNASKEELAKLDERIAEFLNLDMRLAFKRKK